MMLFDEWFWNFILVQIKGSNHDGINSEGMI